MAANQLGEAREKLHQALRLSRAQFAFLNSCAEIQDQEGIVRRGQDLSSCGKARVSRRAQVVPVLLAMDQMTRATANCTAAPPYPSITPASCFQPSSELQYCQPVPTTADEFCSSLQTDSRFEVREQVLRQSAFSAVIIFNMAVTYDLSASRASTLHQIHLVQGKAKALYEKVVELYVLSVHDPNMRRSQHQQDPRPTPRRSLLSGATRAKLDIIVMAACNNLVYLHQDDEAKRGTYLQALLDLSKTLEEEKEDYDGNHELRQLVEMQAGSFLINSFLFGSPNNVFNHGAAAA